MAEANNSVNLMNESDLELYYAAEFLSPMVRPTESKNESRISVSLHRKNLNKQNSMDKICETFDHIAETITCNDEIPIKKPRMISSNESQTVSNFTRTEIDTNLSSPQKLIVELPNEVLEEIFSSLPIYDLLFFVNRVCRRFNNIISDSKYLFYKKTYFKYRMGDKKDNENSEDNIKNIVRNLIVGPNPVLSDGEKCFAAVAWSTTFNNFPFPKLSDFQSSQMLERLSRFQKFETAENFLSTNCIDENSLNEPTIWNRIAVLILLSDDVKSLTKLLRALIFPPQIVHERHITEFFYCVLLHLTYINETENVACRLNYNLYYALYLFENSGATFLSKDILDPRRPLSKRSNLTLEQERIVKYDLAGNECIRVAAFAGTGKTTALLEYVKRRPDLKFLIIFYNKAVCDDSKKRFPPNACCRTIHSIAYQYMNVGSLYKEKLKSDLYYYNISQVVTKVNIHDINYRTVRALVRTTVLNFLSSEDEKILDVHVPSNRTILLDFERISVPITDKQKNEIVNLATEVWTKMKDPKQKSFPLVHDGYLKMFQLAKPDFKRLFPEIDVIMVDEAQDCNPSTLNIVERQIHPKIVVGDENQQIYGFRGSVNALEKFKVSRTFSLTQSFRFGPEIAYLANCYLQKVKKKTRKILVGTDKNSFVDGRKTNGNLVIICRSNAQVFSECATITEMNQSCKIHVVGGGMETLNFDLLDDLHHLVLDQNCKANKPIKTIQGRYLCNKFKTIAELEKYAQDICDVQLQSKIDLVKRYKLKLPGLIMHIKRCLTTVKDQADFILTTVHKAKGSEFDNVRLAPDFSELEDIREVDRRSDASNEIDDEYNLLYVAMTRAKTSLIINKPIFNVIFNLCRDGLQSLIRFADLPEDYKKMVNKKCQICAHTFDVSTNLDGKLVLYRKPLALSTGIANEVSFSRHGLQCCNCFLPKSFSSPYNDDKICFYNGNMSPGVTSMTVHNLRKISKHLSPFYK